MKKLGFKIIVLLLLSQGFFSCLKGEEIDETPTATNEEISGEITANTTWYANKIYVLNGKVIVKNQATLTIEPGTIIKGKQGDGLNASALIIAKNAKIKAIGTPTNPIIFTSVLDNIELGQKTGTNLDERDVQKWGGLIVLGNAKVSDKVGDTEGHIEGIPADADYGTYGGNNNNDNSGILKYVSIRHGGVSIGDGNEINGLTLGGVGSGTTIDHIEVVATLDDGIECFGGTVTISHALVAYQQDDAFDIDQNFAGSFINSMVICDNTGDKFLEIDGPENNTNKNGLFTVENCKFISKTNDGKVDFKSKAQGTVTNNIFEGLATFKLSTKLDSDCTTLLTDAYNHYINGTLIITENKTNASLNVYTKSKNNNDTTCTIPQDLQTNANIIYNASNNTENTSVTLDDLEEFNGWSWTSVNSKF